MLRTVPHIGRNHGNQHSIVAEWRLNELGLKVAKKNPDDENASFNILKR